MTVPWWRHHFDDDYFTLHDPLFDEARSRREVAGVRELLALPVGARVLDAPCGWGRHTALLAEAGLHVTGADLSPQLLRRAPREADAVVTPVYVAADIRSLPFADASFDAVINVYTSLGLFLDDDADIAALHEARRVLERGGALLLESMHRDDVMTDYAERDAWTLPDGTEIRVRRRFDPITGISHEQLQWRRGAERGRKRHSLRLRTATEIDRLLCAAGFHEVQYFGDWSGRPFRHRAESLIAVARP
ncbi:MAG TPA: class I SAM-dependent methyltransferase [Longimicrobiales bacterium]|nr:class I SAM-dependent methyltransferase [Longimicrobiales bacterium]